MNRKIARRDFVKISAVAGAVLAGAGYASKRWLGADRVTVHETRYLMGTIIHLTLVASSRGVGREAIQATFDEMSRLVGIFDHRDKQAALGRLNAAGRLDQTPAELLGVLASAIRYGDLTDGAFDVTIQPVLDAIAAGRAPAKEKAWVDYRKIQIDGWAVRLEDPGMAVTLDGIAKGYIVDKAVDVLEANGYLDVLVEAGGDLRGLGAAIDRPWRVGVQDPRRESDILAVFDLSSAAAATSGDYRNAFTTDRSAYHIIDPSSGGSPSELASATVLAPRAADADALSTSLMVLGAERGLRLVEQLAGVEAIVVGKDQSVTRSSGFPSED